MKKRHYETLVIDQTDFNEYYILSLNIPELVKVVAVYLFEHGVVDGELANETRRQLKSLDENGIHTLEV